ncbi:MAG: hypothetical protein WAV88_05025 [Candidatus Nanopelagicales bacterium]
MRPHAKARRRSRVRVIASASAVALVAGLGVVAAAAGPAQAAEGPIAYTFSGGKLHVAGVPYGTFSGHFVFDASACPAGECPGAYSSVNITTSATAPFVAKAYTTSDVGPTSTKTDFGVVNGVGPADYFYFPFGPGVLGTTGTHNVPAGDHPGIEYQPANGIRAVSAGTIVGTHPKVTVSSRKSKKISRRAKTTVVTRAGVDPSWTGSLRSVTAKCSLKRSPLKSSKLCKVTTNRSTGKVTVKPKGYRGTKVKVTIKTKALVPSVYRAQTWKKTWTVQ